MNHPFTDGNKRTAWLSTKWFLSINDYRLKATWKEAVVFMEAVDNEKLTLIEISRWLRHHSQPLS
jgi:death-on-curing protein